MFQEGKIYSLSELTKVISESQEFKPVMGKNVETDDKKNNEKAVKDIMKETDEYDGGFTEKERKTNTEDSVDYNKTTLDVDFAYEPSDSYKERVKAQVKGFPSVENEKNTEIEENDSLDFDGNEKFYDEQKKKREEVSKTKTDIKHAGLKSHNLPKENFKDKTIFKNENKTMKRLHFKNTVFLSEAQMLKKVPEEYKIDGNKFYMKDANGTEYLIECVKDKTVDYVYTNVIGVTNKQKINEELNRIKELSSYDSGNYFKQSSSESRRLEENKFSDMINRVKELSVIKK